MSVSAVAKKLQLHKAQRALILNGPEAYMQTLGKIPEEVTLEKEPEGTYDFAHLFVKNRDKLNRFIEQVLEAITYDGILWISYPKGSSGVATDLNRDSLSQALTEKGIRPVTQVSIDEVWSALRFRPTASVGR